MKEAHKAERQLQNNARKFQRSQKNQIEYIEGVVDQTLIEILDTNEKDTPPRAPKPQHQRQAPAYLQDYIL